MPVTARDVARRAFLIALAGALVADTRQEIVDLLEALASALSEGNDAAFLERFDHSMPDYDKLERYIDALAAEDQVSCSIDILKQEGDAQAQSLQLDWFLEIHPRELLGPVERRRQTVKIRLGRQKKKWKVIALEPITLFAPPGVR